MTTVSGVALRKLLRALIIRLLNRRESPRGYYQVVDYRIEIEAKRRIVLITFQNDLTESSFTAGFFAAAAFAETHPVGGVITNLSEIRELVVSGDRVRTFVDSYPAIAPSTPRVVVAPRDDTYGIARMFQTYRASSDTGLQVVRSMDEALKFLGLDSPVFEPIPSPETSVAPKHTSGGLP